VLGSGSAQRVLLVLATGLLVGGLMRDRHLERTTKGAPAPDDPGLEVRLDLNSASAADLESLPGVGVALAALVFAAVIGVLGGIGWLLVLSKIRDFPNTISSTLAYVFIVYGVTELLGFSGAIAALALGVALTNFEKFGLHNIQRLDRQLEPLSAIDLAFYREAVFLLKTYFFVYLGISIHFGASSILLGAIALVLSIYTMRLVLTRFVYKDPEYALRDTAITSMLAPKGLASAVLATLPLQANVAGGEMIRDTAYMVILVSITLSALLVMAFPSRLAQRLYSAVLGKPTSPASE
jgi:NhaP-type Na+/H+ or K+/H+ antiporter